MKTLATLSLLLLTTAGLFAQNVKISGFATLQNSSGQAAFPMELTMSKGAVVSKTDPRTGYFEITCPPSGDYFLEINKAGYEVVNPRTLHLFFFEKKANVDTLRIALNREGAWLDLADRYFRGGMTIVNNAHQAKIAGLKKNTPDATLANPVYRKALDELAKRVINVHAGVPDAAENSARTDADRCSPAFRQALRLFSEGNAAEALQALATVKSARELALRARLKGLTLDDTGARSDFEAACAAAPLDFQLAREYARYLLNLPNQNAYARRFWEKMLPKARHDNERATALQGIAVAVEKQEGIQFLEQAAQIRERLSAANPFFGPDYAFTCRVLGERYQGAGDIPLAIRWLEKASAIWSGNLNACGFTFCTEPMAVSTDLAVLSRQPALIQQGLEKAAADYQRLATHYATYGYYRKALMLNLVSQSPGNDAAGTSAALREMTSIWDEYEEEWPFFITFSRKGTWKIIAQASPPDAPGGDVWQLSKGIEKLRTAAQTAPGVFEIDLATCLNIQAFDQRNSESIEASLKTLAESRELLEPYLSERPAEAVLPFAQNADITAGAYMQQKDFQKAGVFLDQALTLLQSCSQCDPSLRNARLVRLLTLSGNALFFQGQKEKAVARSTAGVEIQRLIMATEKDKQTVGNTANLLQGLAFLQISLALETDDENQKIAAQKTIAEAEKLLDQFPEEPAFAPLRKQLQELKNSLTD